MSWEADAQLVRGATSGFNLAIGEPLFLREVFGRFYPRHYPADLSYPDSRPDPFLQRELEKLHPGQHVVVTLGAKQALYAAAHALAPYAHTLCHRSPFWPTYPTIAQYARLDFCGIRDDRPGHLVCNTSPNNPDGSESLLDCDIWDAAYAHEVYGWSGRAPDHHVSVWSAGKMLGTPGLRVGWLCTERPEIAEAARRYVEQTTSGVPTTSQYHVAYTLYATQDIRPQLFQRARDTLLDNAEQFYRLIPWTWDIEGLARGMFAWLRPRDPDHFKACLAKAGILMVSGEACGLPGWFRASLGLDTRTTRAAIDALLAQLEGP